MSGLEIDKVILVLLQGFNGIILKYGEQCGISFYRLWHLNMIDR